MKSKWTLAALVAAVFVVGCGGSPTGQVDPDYMAKAPELGKQRREYFVRAKGDYNALSPEERKGYIDTFDGDEKQAERFWTMMQNPPRSAGPEIPGQAR